MSQAKPKRVPGAEPRKETPPMLSRQRTVSASRAKRDTFDLGGEDDSQRNRGPAHQHTGAKPSKKKKAEPDEARMINKENDRIASIEPHSKVSQKQTKKHRLTALKDQRKSDAKSSSSKKEHDSEVMAESSESENSMLSDNDSEADSDMDVEIALDEKGVPQIVKKIPAQFDPKGSLFRKFCYIILMSRWFKGLILSVILINSVVVTVQTSKSADAVIGWWTSCLDNIFLGIYITELVLKLYVLRFHFFRSAWNWFDLLIVLSSFLEWLDFLLILSSSVSFNPKTLRLLRVMRAFRALRALRVLRTISVLKNLQVIIVSLLRSIPAMGGVVILLYMVMYFFVIVGRQQYGETMPDKFGNMWVAHFSLFQLLTLDDWFTFYDAGREDHPEMIFYLVAFIIIETFIFMNLFVAVIVDNLERYQRKIAKRRMKNQQKKKDKLTKLKKSVKLAKSKVTVVNDDSEMSSSVGDTAPEQSTRLAELSKQYCLILASLDKNSETIFRQDHNVSQLMNLSEADNNQLA